MNIDISTIKQFCDKAAFFCAISFMIFIPSSTALMNIFIFLTLIFMLFAGNIKNHVTIAWKNPVVRSALFLFAVLTLSLTWTIADISEGFGTLKKYNELWYIALILPLFNTHRRREIGILCYLFSMTIILIGVYLVFFKIMVPLEWTVKGHDGYFTINGFASHIITNILMAFAMFIAAHKSVLTKSFYKLPYIAFFVFSAYYVFLISAGTSGQLLGIVLLTLFIVQHAGIRSALIIPILLALFAVLGYFSEDNSIRHTAVDKLKLYYHYAMNVDNEQTSRMFRLEGDYDTAGFSSRPQIYINSLNLIKYDRWVGTGIGSYQDALRTKNPKFYNASPYIDNPHNEFILMAVQMGLIGLIFLFYLFYTQASYSEKVKHNEHRYIVQGLVVLIIIGCLGNSMILDSRLGHFWAFFSALLFSNLNEDFLGAKS